MKKFLIAACLIFFIAGSAKAQTTDAGKSTSSSSTTQLKPSKKSGKKHKPATTATNKNQSLNQRENYNYTNGQSSTPTGKDATPVNGGYAALKADTTRKPKPKKQ